MLDHVSDPQNIGAIIRSALTFGVNAVVTSKDNAPSENAHILKAAVGTFEHMPYIQVTNMSNAIKQLKKSGYWVFALSQDAKDSVEVISQYEKRVLLLGAEGKGIRPNILNKCDMQVNIATSALVESLNVSNAVAISLYVINSIK